MPDISVIIPTLNRFDALRLTLDALASQSLPSESLEVIVVDDGSDDRTPEQLKALKFPFKSSVIRQGRLGASAARNAGAAQADSDILCFLDADMISVSAFLEEHLRSHAENEGVIVAGQRVPWPAARTSLFSQLLDLDTNAQPGDQISFQEVFSANFSIRKSDFCHLGGFDRSFPVSGCEDIEFVYRAVQSGLRIEFNPLALGYHNHPTDFDQARQKAFAYASSTALMFSKHPELRGRVAHLQDKEPIAWREDTPGQVVRKLARLLLAQPLALRAMEAAAVRLERSWPNPVLLRFLYWKILGAYQLRGLRQGLIEYSGMQR